jgi:hypothetical protein
VSGNTAHNGELVYMIPTTDDGKKLLAGKVKINFPDLNLAHAIRLVRLPEMDFSNPGGQSHGTGKTGSNPTFSPIVAQTYLDPSVTMAYQCCVKGNNIGQVMIYQLVSSGANELTILSTYTLENTFLAKWYINFDAPTDQVTGDGIVATYVLMCTGITPAQGQFDATGTKTGTIAAEVNNIKGTVSTKA